MEKFNGLSEIELYNIQKHKHIKLSLDGINVLVGETESGKTSILRGLLWNMKNNTSGSSIVTNDGSTYCSCTVKVDGHEVQRKWSTTENSYSIDGKLLTSIRTSVPSEIKELYNIDDVNIQCRRDLPFMLYYKDTECASQFGQMLNIEEIDRATSAINSRVRECTNAHSAASDNITKLETELNSLSFIDDAEIEIEKISSLRNELSSLHTTYAELDSLYNTIKTETCTIHSLYSCLEDSMLACRRIETMYSMVESTKKALNSSTELHDEHVKLDNMLSKQRVSLSGAQDMLSSIEDISSLVNAHKSMLKSRIPLYNEIKECIATISKDEKLMSDQLYPKIVCLVSEKTSVERRYKEVVLLHTDIENATAKVACATKKYNDEHDKFEKAFPDVCPLCGTPVKGDHAHTSIS